MMIRTGRIGFVHAMLALFALGILGKAAHVQLVHGAAWRARAERQQYAARDIPAMRGQIRDAAGRVLAESKEMVRLEIAPGEVRDRAALRRSLMALGLSPEWARRAVDTTRAWVTLPGRYVAVDVAPIAALRGVYATGVVLRSYAGSEGVRRLIGRVDANDRPLDGLELGLDSLLRGTLGSTTLLRDVRGRTFESPTTPGHAPVAGHSIVLTLNAELQEIAERSLADAVARLGAQGGDIVILDPHSGHILALASRRAESRSTAATALTEPFEPGSTLKPMIAAGLLELGRAQPDDSVDTGTGVAEFHGRRIRDEHPVGRAPLTDVIRWSSNVGIARFAERLTPREQFETLRDFGFGTATGVPYPSEASGTLREPRRWSRQSAASLAMGYEVAVTPLQLASAYAAIANGGELVEPALIKEIRAPGGALVYQNRRRVVRRVMSPEVAAAVRGMLVDVVEAGTAVEADLREYHLAGKTGTPRRTVDGRYAPMQYNPNFVGIFPADAPQYVILVKLTNPQGTFYAGRTAAPLSRAILEAAIASRDVALDRGKLASSAAPSRAGSGRATAPPASSGDGRDFPGSYDAAVPFLVTLASGDDHEPASPPPPAIPARPIPDVRELPLRDAVRSLHDAGFRVQLAPGSGGGGRPGTTVPAAGQIAAPGALVRLHHNY